MQRKKKYNKKQRAFAAKFVHTRIFSSVYAARILKCKPESVHKAAIAACRQETDMANVRCAYTPSSKPTKQGGMRDTKTCSHEKR